MVRPPIPVWGWQRFLLNLTPSVLASRLKHAPCPATPCDPPRIQGSRKGPLCPCRPTPQRTEARCRRPASEGCEMATRKKLQDRRETGGVRSRSDREVVSSAGRAADCPEFLHHQLDVAVGHRMREQVPLALGAIELDQRVELRFGLDSLGNHSFAERRAHRDDRPHHFLSVATTAHATQEGTIDLDLSDRKVLQRA